MGKGTVLENLGRGLYNIRLDLGSVRRQQLIDGLTFQIDELLAARADLYAAVVSARVAHQAALDAYNAAVAEYVDWKRGTEEPDPDPDAKTPDAKLEDTTRALAEAGDALREAERELQQNESETRNLERKRERLERTPGTRDLQAWCPDRTDYLDPGDPIATLEVPNEPQSVLVAPGGSTAQGSGDLMKTDFQVSYQAFYNAAILPGWQLSMPTYRFGTITAINEDLTCNVNVTLAVSKAQGLSVNREDALQNVPILYRQCDAAAFAPGDEVVIEFRDRLWTSPRVIGFRENPPFCRGVFCRVTGSGQTRKAFPIDRGATYSWFTPVVESAFFGHIGWAGPDGSVSWDAWGLGWSRYVYHRNVDYGIMELFPDLYWYVNGADHCYPVILGCFVMGDTIVVVVETEAYVMGEEGFVYQPELYRLDVLAIKPRSFDAPMEGTERYVIHQIQRDPVMRQWSENMALARESNPGTPPPTKTGSGAANVGAAHCQGFSIKPDGTQFVYCNHTGAYHVELSEAKDGTLTASHMMHPSMLEGWEEEERRAERDRTITTHISGYAIVGATWDETGPTWIYYRADGDHVATRKDEVTATFSGGDFDGEAQQIVRESSESLSIYLRLTGEVPMQIALGSRSMYRRDQYDYAIVQPPGQTEQIELASYAVTDHTYSVSLECDEVATIGRDLFGTMTVKPVEISPQTGLYVADRYQCTARASAALCRVVVSDGIVMAAGSASSWPETSPPVGHDPSVDMVGFEGAFVPPLRFDWFFESTSADGGFSEQAPTGEWGYWTDEYGDPDYWADRYIGTHYREIDAFARCSLGEYWRRGLGVLPPSAFKSAEVRGAVFLSTDIDGTPFHYMSGVDSVAEQFGATDPITFDYIVAG